MVSIGMVNWELGVEGAKAMAEMHQAMASLTSLNLSSETHSVMNSVIGPEGGTAIIEALQGNKTLRELNLWGNDIGSDAAKLMATWMAANSSLTHCDVRFNDIIGEGATQLSEAVLANTKIEVFNVIPIKEMRADSLTTLDLSYEHIGVVGGMVVAGLVPVMPSLTVANVLYTSLDVDSAKMLAEVAKQKGISLCGIKPDATKADLSSRGLHWSRRLGPVDAILIASDLAVRASLTAVDLSFNNLGGGETGDIKAFAVHYNEKDKVNSYEYRGREMIVSMGKNSDGNIKMKPAKPDLSGVKAIADALRVCASLKEANIRQNNLNKEAEKQLRGSVKRRKGFELLL